MIDEFDHLSLLNSRQNIFRRETAGTHCDTSGILAAVGESSMSAYHLLIQASSNILTWAIEHEPMLYMLARQVMPVKDVYRFSLAPPLLPMGSVCSRRPCNRNRLDTVCSCVSIASR
jgi:hypothetical protein